MYILIAILVFGFLIAIHELGHFAAAKFCGVKVNEFAVGMGPAIWKKQKGETLYALRALPFGGYCAMEGENEESSDPRSFESKVIWQKLIIMAAGSFMNFMAGFVTVLIVYASATGFVGNTVVDISEGFPYGGENGLMAGDTILEIDGERVYYSKDFSMFMSLAKGNPVDMVVLRDGEKITLNDYPLQPHEYETNGTTTLRYGLEFNTIEATVGEKLKYSVYSTYNFVRNVRMGLVDLITGDAGVGDLTGPVGIVTTINDVAASSSDTVSAIKNIAFLCAFIAVNLAVVNMLPIPALDGGRIFFLLVSWVIEKITHKRLDPKYEGRINLVCMALLLLLMALVMVNDVVRIFNG